ncbi:hypothetical protein [Roseiflexus castenholzii]|uniref:hypothetical protein n=1 Tax=Roseiflexus castenholzii TaxID=120962 RepID=UPI003C7CF2B3
MTIKAEAPALDVGSAREGLERPWMPAHRWNVLPAVYPRLPRWWSEGRRVR